MRTSADSALVVGRFLVRRLPGVHRAAGVHRFVSPFAHFFITYMSGVFLLSQGERKE